MNYKEQRPWGEFEVLLDTELGSYFGEDDIVRINDKYERI
jgi:hypothetical protein